MLATFDTIAFIHPAVSHIQLDFCSSDVSKTVGENFNVFKSCVKHLIAYWFKALSFFSKSFQLTCVFYKYQQVAQAIRTYCRANLYYKDEASMETRLMKALGQVSVFLSLSLPSFCLWFFFFFHSIFLRRTSSVSRPSITNTFHSRLSGFPNYNHAQITRQSHRRTSTSRSSSTWSWFAVVSSSSNRWVFTLI